MKVAPVAILQAINISSLRSPLAVAMKCREKAVANPFRAIVRKITRVTILKLTTLKKISAIFKPIKL
jgi:hypothetical protein